MQPAITASDIVAVLEARGYGIVGRSLDEHVWAPPGEERFIVLPVDTSRVLSPRRLSNLLRALRLDVDTEGRLVPLEWQPE